MIALLKRHVFMVVAAGLAWNGWRASAEPPAEAKAGSALAPAAIELPAPRDPATPPAELPDPFRLAVLLARLAELERSDAGLSVDAEYAAGGEEPPAGSADASAPGVAGRLRLDSTLNTGFSTSAVINGRSYRTGDAIEGLDSDAPPVLSEIDGRRIVVEYRGRSYELDLALRREIELSPVLAPLEEAPR